ncbi:uncharacterized protein LOC111054443 [Nilaparvata lugens]|uniref:uncharacterized protein LOC111054443 n=1 Tax=Nilaparvata lugens TaxID=108931 RepID=UPI00193EC063|nr:uncharacterized protein LOC111054443 [Nilaparvata lugens]
MDDRVIRAVRKKSVLYDPNDRDYLNIKVKTQLWDEIAVEVGLANGAAVKTIWEKLRHSFRDALRRQKNMIRSGVAPESLKTWKHQSEMAFLLPYMNSRRRDTSSYQDDSDNDNSQMAHNNFEDGPTEIDLQDLMGEEDIAGHSTLSLGDNSALITSTSKKRKLKPRKTSKNQHDITSMLKQQMEEQEEEEVEVPPIAVRKVEERRDSTLPKDPLYHFFISMYETTIKMPPAAQHTVRNQIFNAVTNMEATLLDFKGIPRS